MCSSGYIASVNSRTCAGGWLLASRRVAERRDNRRMVKVGEDEFKEKGRVRLNDVIAQSGQQQRQSGGGCRRRRNVVTLPGNTQHLPTAIGPSWLQEQCIWS